jgi:hypothetical protein
MYYTMVDKGFNPCRYYYLVQGCYDEVTCGGTAYITVLGSGHPTSIPSGQPSMQPSAAPSGPSSQPSGQPSGEPTCMPSGMPTHISTGQPTGSPSLFPTAAPSILPTAETRPSSEPTAAPQVNDIATIMIAVLLPVSALLVTMGSFLIYRHYKIRYYRRMHSKKVRCVTSINCADEDILTQIDFYGEF